MTSRQFKMIYIKMLFLLILRLFSLKMNPIIPSLENIIIPSSVNHHFLIINYLIDHRQLLIINYLIVSRMI